jgi:RNA polymerase-binding transcription factor DksA
MPDVDAQQVAARLDERQREIERRREELRRNGDGMTDELADYDQHPADQGTETFEQELDETTLMILEEEERRVSEARKALEEGRYGICIDCGKEIPAARLEAIPESVRCVEDQRLYEARLRQRGAPGASPDIS